MGLEGETALIQVGLAPDPLSHVGLRRLSAIQRRRVVRNLAVGRVELATDPALYDPYYAQADVKLPVLTGKTMDFIKAFGLQKFPAVVLVDRWANVHYRGPLPGEHLLDQWTRRLNGLESDPGQPEKMFDAVAADMKALRGTELPELESGRNGSLADYLTREGLLVVFTDVTCEFTGSALEDLPGVAAKLDSYNVPTVIVNVGNAVGKVEDYYGDRHLHLPVLYDETKKTAKSWDVKTVPTVAFFRGDGFMLYRGAAVWEDLSAGIAGELGTTAAELQFEAEGTGFG
ncbi:MAG: hypothetical protein ACLFV7_01065 [Phycisphaerae bacterium]